MDKEWSCFPRTVTFRTRDSATAPRHLARTTTRSSGSPKNWLRVDSTESCVTLWQPILRGSRGSDWTDRCCELTPKPEPRQRLIRRHTLLWRATFRCAKGPGLHCSEQWTPLQSDEPCLSERLGLICPNASWWGIRTDRSAQ